jgi:Putative prokaryotic signal transducing protein
MKDDSKTVRVFSDRGEAEIARSLLEAEGIEASLTADDIYPTLDFSGGLGLVVAAADVERARALLDEKVSEQTLDDAERETE